MRKQENLELTSQQAIPVRERTSDARLQLLGSAGTIFQFGSHVNSNIATHVSRLLKKRTDDISPRFLETSLNLIRCDNHSGKLELTFY